MSTVKQILTNKGNDVFTADPNTKVLDALRMMDEKGFGVLIIVEDDAIKGLFTEGDYISRALLQGLNSSTTVLDDVMTKDVQTVKPELTVNESMQIMIDKDIRYFPVVDEGKLLGVISVGDCVREVIAEQKELIDHLEHYIQS